MKRCMFLVLIFLCLICGLQNEASAMLIIDTGTPADQWGYAVMNRWGTYESLAAEFSITDPGYSISGIEGYFYTIAAGNIFVSINTDGGDNPSSTSLYSGSFYLSPNVRGWVGINNITALNLQPGAYWVIFSASSNAAGGMPINAPNPLGNEGYYYTNTTSAPTWTGRDSLNLGIKISGTPAVPEPASASLFILGLFIKMIKRSR